MRERERKRERGGAIERQRARRDIEICAYLFDGYVSFPAQRMQTEIEKRKIDDTNELFSSWPSHSSGIENNKNNHNWKNKIVDA